MAEKKVGRPPGTPKTGGRSPGTPNKVNAEFRETVRMLLEENRDNVRHWLSKVANGDGETLKADPGKALDLLVRLAEFAAPKLGRVEHVGDGGGPVATVTRIELVDLYDNSANSPAA
jgi:hypothetical protein